MIENENHDGCDWYFGVPFPSKRKAAEAQSRNPKIGDRVRVVKEGHLAGGSCHQARVGDVFSVRSVESNGAVYTGRWFLWPGEFELAQRFPRGARIRLTRNHGVYKKGHVGTVTVENDENVGVLMDIGRYAAFPHDVLEVVDAGSAPDCAGRKVEREFKAGDVVRCLSDYSGQFTQGKLYTVSEFPNRHGHVGVKLDDGGSTTNGLSAKNFELVTPAPCPQDNEQVEDTTLAFLACAPQPAIVALVNKDGKPRPSQWPHVHPDTASATAEAERLARNNPGTEFAVYQRVAGRKAEVSVEMKEVA